MISKTSDRVDGNTSHPTKEGYDLFHFARILQKRWKIAFFAVIAGASVAVALQLVTPPKYESSSQMLVMRKDPRLAAKGLNEGNADSEVKVTEELLATHMQMIQSRLIVEGALEGAGLTELPSIVQHLDVDQKPADYVIENLTVSRGGRGQARMAHVLNVSMRSRDAVDAQRVLSAIIKQYQGFLASKFQDVNQEAAGLIADAQTQLASELEEAEKSYEEFRQKSSHLMGKKIGEQTTNIHRVRYDSILQDITNLQLSSADASGRLDAVAEVLKGRPISELNELERLSLVDEKNLTRVGLLLMVQKGESESPVFQAEQPIRLAQARSQFESVAEMIAKEQTLLTELGGQHPDVISLRKQIVTLQDYLDKQKLDLKSGNSKIPMDSNALFAAYHSLLKNDVLAMKAREARLESLASDSLRQASEMVTDEIELDSLRRDVERKQQLFDAAVDRLREINLAKDYGGFINEVLAAPDVGLVVSPKLVTSAAVGFLLAAVLGIFGIGVAEYRDRRFRSMEDVKNGLQLSILARIPFVDQLVAKSRLRGRFTGNASGRRILSSDSVGADAFRLLRTSLLFKDGDEIPQILCVTSPNAAEGKSSTAGNLGVSLSQLGRKVLIVDCDLRMPTQHELFDQPNERGLTSVLQGECDPADAIQATPNENVWLMSRGPEVKNPAEFLATGEFARLLESLRDKYDHIILDCPPVLPVVDTLATASLADGVVFVIWADRTSQYQAVSACAALRQAGAHLEGVVVNGLKTGTLGDDYYEAGYGSYMYRQPSGDSSESKRGSSTTSRLSSSGYRNGSSNSALH